MTQNLRTIETTPALYGFIWGTPRLILDVLVPGQVKYLKTAAISDLFPKLIEDQDIPVKFNFEVVVNSSFLQKYVGTALIIKSNIFSL